MTAEWVAAITGFVTGLAGVVIAVNTARQAAKKDQMQAMQATLDALVKENDRLRARLDELEAENNLYRSYSARLARQLVSNGIEPHGLDGDLTPGPFPSAEDGFTGKRDNAQPAKPVSKPRPRRGEW